jgi:hypothetical protein
MARERKGPSFTVGAWACILSAQLTACGGRSHQDRESPSAEDCAESGAARAEATSDDLELELACGAVSATAEEYSAFVNGGQPCQPSNGINTFALRLSGGAASRYSAVVRCGYIRYDNGTFVGQRIEVEARDGAFCHEPALRKLQPVDRMLLTDVSFAIEASCGAPEQDLVVQFETRSGWTQSVPAEEQLCAYVAFRAPGASACRMAAPASYCTCPAGSAWDDFFTAVTLSLATR